MAFAQAQDGGIYFAEEKEGRADSLTRIRHIDRQGVVTTFLTGEDCSGGHDCPAKTLGVDAIAIDRDGSLLLAAQRMGHTERGQFRMHSTAYRINPVTRETKLLAFAAMLVPYPGAAYDNFNGVAFLPDGRPISRSVDQGGFVLLDRFKPALNYWLTWSKVGQNDGHVATSNFGNNPFCVANDGSIFVATPDHSMRRLDPVTHLVSTWLR